MKKHRVLLIIIVIILIVLIAGVMYLVERYSPTKERADLTEYYGNPSADDVVVVRDRSVMDYFGKSVGGAVYLPYRVVHESLNDRFYVDTEGLLLYVTNDRENMVSLGQTDSSYTEVIYANGEVTQNVVPLETPALAMLNDELYLSLDYVKRFTPLDYTYYADPARIVLTTSYHEISTTEVKKKTALRVKGGIKSPILKDLAAGDKLTILDEEENWYKAVSEDGVIGYVEKRRVGEPAATVLTSDFVEETYTHILHEGTVNLIWHQVTNTDVNAQIETVLSGTKGVNVVSPTWFYLNDNEGNVMDLASKSYVDYCHANGVQVWGLVSNLENKDIEDEAIISKNSTRKNFIQTMIGKATEYGLDGINLDFEAISAEAGESFVELVRELSLECANHGLILSVDNYVPTESSTHYDRAEQARYADYLIIMGYDEHYNGSTEGSVASLPWVIEGVENTISAGVPENQIILGMPFYTRIWEETPKTGASDLEMASEDYVPYELSSRAVGMKDQNSTVASKGAAITWLPEMGQNYAEWSENGLTYKVWLEDAMSLEQKLQVVQNHSLAGGAFWKVTMEDPSVWDVIVNYLS